MHQKQEDFLTPEQKNALIGIAKGTWVSFHDNNIIFQGNSQKDALSQTAEYFRNINVKPQKLTVIQVGMPIPTVHINAITDEDYVPSNSLSR